MGAPSSGKTALRNCICGTLPNEIGAERFDGTTMNGLTAHQRTRRGLARSFQLPRPFASLSVAENLRVPLLYTVNARSGPHLSAADIDARTAELLSLVGLANRGGQQPRDLTQVDMRKL